MPRSCGDGKVELKGRIISKGVAEGEAITTTQPISFYGGVDPDTGEIIEKLGQISYWFTLREEMAKVNKTVHFYLMKFLGGNTADHDNEVDEARWYPMDDALKTLSFKSEREIMHKAKEMIEKIGFKDSRDPGSE